MTALDAALDYAARGWPVHPVGADKHPLTSHGKNDATRDPALIREWWRRSPAAVPSIVTGEPSGIVALDIDIRPDGSGFDSLEQLGVFAHPISPTRHSPSGGCAVLFRWPGHFVKTSNSELAPHLDIKGDRGSLMLPPGPGRFWDPHLGPDTPLAAMPAWMVIAEQEVAIGAATPFSPRPQPISRYAEAALDGAVKAIVTAPAGQQQVTLNREVYGIAQLVAGGEMPARLAIESLQWAARQMRSLDRNRPWRPAETDRIVRAAFADGLARPRRRAA